MNAQADGGKIERVASINQVVGARVRLMRIDRGLSQSALAQALGVTFQQIQKYERGENGVSIVALIVIAQALGCSAAFFIPDYLVSGGRKSKAVRALQRRDAVYMVMAFDKIASARDRKVLLELATRMGEPDETL